MNTVLEKTIRPFIPSAKQQTIFDWVKTGSGNAVVIAVAGSGKSTTMVRCLDYIHERASVLLLAFGADAAADLRAKIEKLAAETGRDMRQVSARTFHSLGLAAVRKRLDGKQLITDDRKVRKLARANWDEDTFKLYAGFCTKLVNLAKGEGIGCLTDDTEDAWLDLIEHHDFTLESEEATVERAVKLCQGLMKLSNEAAEKGSIDYADMLYLPILWKLQLYGQSWVIVDEAQDSNPVRRCLAYMAMSKHPRWPGRLIAVGDPKQSIMGFTGATSDAIERIKAKFRAIELPLTVSYRCPKAVGRRAQQLVPYFEVHEDAPEGEELDLPLDEAISLLGPANVVICRNTRPLVGLAYQLIAQGVACNILGKEIGEGLIELIEQMNSRTVDGLMTKLEAYRLRETTKLREKEEDVKADAIDDRVACIMTFAESLREGERTLAILIKRIESLFEDKAGVLTLCTAHKSKGKEWPTVAILEPELMPGRARNQWQAEQEDNLIYVAVTRAQERLIWIETEDNGRRMRKSDAIDFVRNMEGKR